MFFVLLFMILFLMLNFFLNLLSYLLDIVNFEFLSFLLGCLVFFCNIGLVSGMFLIVVFCYYLYVIVFMFCVCDVLVCFESVFLFEMKVFLIVISMLYFLFYIMEIGMLCSMCSVLINIESVLKSMSDNWILKVFFWMSGFYVYKDWWIFMCGEILFL